MQPRSTIGIPQKMNQGIAQRRNSWTLDPEREFRDLDKEEHLNNIEFLLNVIDTFNVTDGKLVG